MSGIKYSKLEIEAGRKRRIELVASIGALQKECEGLQKIIAENLKEFSGELKTIFQGDVNSASEWLNKNLEKCRKANINNDFRSLEQTNSEILRMKDAGAAILNKLNDDLTQKAPEMEKKLKREYSDIESKIAGYRELLVLWFGEEHVKDIENNMNKIQNFIKAKDYKKAEALISKLNNKLNSNLNEAKELEEKDHKRDYVLSSLRNVAREMGFKETTPKFETPENEPMHKRSRIIYKVDTYDQGKIKFYLSLDDISANSGIVENKCMGEFDKISEKLKKKFGVNTKFKKKQIKITGKKGNEKIAKPEENNGSVDAPKTQNIHQ